MTVVIQGSVKNIYMDSPPTATEFGSGYMEFRRGENGDPFSIFDYGTMPWGVSGKADNLYMTSLKFFEMLENAGISTHFDGDMGDRKIRIRLANMPEVYSAIIPGKTVVYRVPIECVYSKVVTPVSSLHGRLRRGEEKPEKYGLERPPRRGETILLPEIKTTFSTKIEATDVYKGLEELARMGGLVNNEHEKLRELTVRAGQELMGYGAGRGVIVADGKFEFVLDAERQLIICDTGLSWDENRLLADIGGGAYVDLSKQIVRNIYTISAPEWKDEIKRLLQGAKSRGIPKSRVSLPAPPDIDTKLKDLCAHACSVVSNALVGKDAGSELLSVAADVYEALENLKRKCGRDETGEPL